MDELGERFLGLRCFWNTSKAEGRCLSLQDR